MLTRTPLSGRPGTRPTGASTRAPAHTTRRTGALRVSAFGPGGDLMEGLEAGTRVRVTAAVKVRERGERERGNEGKRELGDAASSPVWVAVGGPRVALAAPLDALWSRPRLCAQKGGVGQSQRSREGGKEATSPPDPLFPSSHKPPTSSQVYHVPKTPELVIQGMEGTITEVVKVYKGQELSSTLPYKVQLDVPPPADGGKAPKVIVHLDGSEVEKV